MFKIKVLAFMLVVPSLGVAQSKKDSSYTPVQITSLIAKYVPENKAVNIHWATAGEKERVQYIIERSLDSLHFRMIGETRSSGSSKGNQQYYFYDSYPVGGKMYYRIREIDAMDKQFITRVVKVNTPIAEMNLAQLFLSGDGNELNFAVVSPDSSRVNILVSDVAGHIRASFVLDLKRGANLRSIYTGNLSPGVYFLQVNSQDGESSVMKKFIKKVAVEEPKTDSLKHTSF